MKKREDDSYWHELHVLEELLYETSGGQTKRAVRQEVRNLRVQADVIKRVGELFLYPAVGRKKL